MEPISPELALVDPELARRARALLPAPAAVELLREDAAAAPPPRPRRLRIRPDHLTRVATWLVVPSIALNVALFRTDSAAEPSPLRTPPRVVTVTIAPIAPTAKSPAAQRTARPRRAGVAAAQHESVAPAHPSVPSPGGVLRWPAAAKAVKYDVVVWLGHRRIADVWTAKSKVAVASLACRGSGRLAPGRYLWFVYPLVDVHARRYGPLAKWGTFLVGSKLRCSHERSAGR